MCTFLWGHSIFPKKDLKKNLARKRTGEYKKTASKEAKVGGVAVSP